MWWCCRRRRRQRPPADLESGGHPPLPPGKQQQFLVSGGSSSGQQQQPKWQPQQHQGAAAVPLPLSAHAAGGAAPVAQDWAFAYKVAAQRLTFATDSSRRTAQPQRWERVDDWLAAAVVRSTEQRWDGCLLYNDDPPEAFPDGSPTGEWNLTGGLGCKLPALDSTLHRTSNGSLGWSSRRSQSS